MSLAFVFPGQGSQSVGMLGELAQTYTQVQQTFQQASDALGYDLWDIVQNGPDEKLNSTDITQPAMLSAGVSIWRIYSDLNGATPDVMAGHSLGEYTALVCAGAMAFEDAIKLVSARGQYMQQAVTKGSGAMAAILGLDDDAVREVCVAASEDDVVEAVNFNSPGQVVIAGNTVAVERATVLAKEKGAKRAVMLPVSVPSHCQLMQPAAEKLQQALKDINIQAPTISVINNVDVATPTDQNEIRDALVRQLYQPVRWVEVIQKMAQQGVQRIVECGPGKVLWGLDKRIDKSLEHVAMFDADSIQSQTVNE